MKGVSSMKEERQFKAFVVRKDHEGDFQRGVEDLRMEQLPAGDVTVKVEYSGVNYKDGLAAHPDGKIVRQYPFIPGIDLAGTVIESSHPLFCEGEQVLCTGYELGVTHYGGYSEYARVKGDWLLKIPEGLSTKEAMAIGTAGFTAAMSINALMEHGLTKDKGPVLVTGATGGVGSIAVSILSKLGYEVYASTGKLETHRDWLHTIGASAVLSRDEVGLQSKGALAAEKWAGVVDPVGGASLSDILKTVKYGGAVALSGLTGGTAFNGTVYPFILRGVSLIGIDSVYCPEEIRRTLWQRLADEWKPGSVLANGIQEKGLEDLPAVLESILQGKAEGRTVVAL